MATVTSDDITEMMAFERLEPWGALHWQQAIGQVAAAVFNSVRTQDSRGEPWHPSDFMPALKRELEGHPDEIQEVAAPQDPEAHSALIDAVMFGRAPV